MTCLCDGCAEVYPEEELEWSEDAGAFYCPGCREDT